MKNLGLCLAGVACVVAMGCGSSGAKSTNDAGTGDDDASTAADAATGDAAGGSLTFTPSNIPASALAGGAPGAGMIFDGAHCGGRSTAEIDTDEGTTDCAMIDADVDFHFVKVAQPDGSSAAAFIAKSLRIDTTMTVTVKGQLPLVIVAFDTVAIAGQLSAAATSDKGVAGGFSARANMSGSGNGPGAGKYNMEGGGGGGSFCGLAGKGGSGNLGGTMYGTATCIPLLGGSSGANGGIYEAGAGGGAIQIVAGTSIQVSATGVITVGGAGGLQSGAGGGSGGAILLEAPAVTIAGALAANGGGGGSGTGTAAGSDGMTDDTPAKGGDSNGEAPGGNGSAGATLNGSDGTLNPRYPDGKFSGGGGGGAGYIRINTTAGAATITGKLSPAATTACVSQGPLT